MLAEENKKHQEELIECIYEMASKCFDDAEAQNMAVKLKSIYAQSFRHSYSEFFPLMLEIANDNNPHNLDYLSNNLEFLRTFVENSRVSGYKEFNKLYRPLIKLSDHINLEIGRLNHYFINEKKITDLEQRYRNLQEDITKTTKDLENAKNSISTVQVELISVLRNR